MLYSKSTGGFYSCDIHGDNIPADAVETTSEEHAALLEGQSQGKIIAADANGRPVLKDPPPPTIEQVIAGLQDGVQKRLDDFAKTRNYNSILSAASYATSAAAKFKTEGQYCVDARDATWAKCYEILQSVQAGAREMPTFEQLIAELPKLVWPESINE